MFHNNFVRGKVSKDYRSKEMGRYVLDVNGEYSSTAEKYFTVQQLSSIGTNNTDIMRVKNALADVVNITNALNRTLVIPPIECTKRGVPFCNMCYFDKPNCFKNTTTKLKYPFKESVL